MDSVCPLEVFFKSKVKNHVTLQPSNDAENSACQHRNKWQIK